MPSDELYQSGSRLRAKYWAGADGSREFSGWFDSMLKVACKNNVAIDKKQRCLPQGYPQVVGPYAWADPACTVPLGALPKGNSPPLFVSWDAPVHLWPVDANAKVTLGTTIYMNGCVATPYDQANGFDVYGVGAEIDPSAFVEFTEMTE